MSSSGNGAPKRVIQGRSEVALSTARSLAEGPLFEPSCIALQAHIADLEADLHSVDFRIQNFYHQRTVILSILEGATARLSTI